MNFIRHLFSAHLLLCSTVVLAQSSPNIVASLQLEIGEQLIDYDVSNDNHASWMIVKNGQNFQLKQWRFSSHQTVNFLPPPQLTLQAIAVHPADNSVLLLTRNNANLYRIERLDQQSAQWKTKVIYQSSKPLRRLVVSAAKLKPSYLQADKASPAHRIYFAQNSAKGWTTYSVRDDGSIPYSLIGSEIIATAKEGEEGPFQLQQGSTLPASIHPSGLAMLTQDEKSCYAKLDYVINDWAVDKDKRKPICGGFLAWTRNGLYLQHWRKGLPGVNLYGTASEHNFTLLPETNILSAPSSLPDGRHLLILTEDSNKQQRLEKVAVDIPAGDIQNAWMYVQDQSEVKAIANNGGAFRPINWQDWLTPQMYTLFDAEAYQCEAGTKYPKRPYLVSTDLFWENIAAAYEGLFILHERHTIMPAFEDFLEQAVTHYIGIKNTSTFAKIILSAAAVQNKSRLDKLPAELRTLIKPEVELIEHAAGNALSAVTNTATDYREFKPRGHYANDESGARYFRALRYLASQQLSTDSQQEIENLPPALKASALKWAMAYDKLIAETRAPLAWAKDAKASAGYARETQQRASLFSLSWGFDNEVFHNTSYRKNWSKDLQISPDQPRLIPSGFDLAAVLGSELAMHLLQSEFKRHPQLATRINALKQQALTAIKPEANLYHAWISTLAQGLSSPPDVLPAESRELWQVKRLQTGLASWTTLRHATVLVNDMTGAQGGQGGFEFEKVIHPAPRGAVEPDPKSFDSMADLLGQIATNTALFSRRWPNTKPVQDMSKAYVKRIQDEAKLLRQLADMARRQIEGKELSAKEYSVIEKIGAAAEHDFLLFKSVHHKDGALKAPDPISKVVDVARSQEQRLLAGVGKPLEWNQSVGRPGARQLFRSAVYSYYEFTAGTPMTDSEWREAEDRTARPQWVQNYLLDKPLGCPKIR